MLGQAGAGEVMERFLPPPVKALPCGHGRNVQQPKLVPAGGEDVQFLVVSWGTEVWVPAAWAEVPSREELKLLRAGCAIARLAS